MLSYNNISYFYLEIKNLSIFWDSIVFLLGLIA